MNNACTLYCPSQPNHRRLLDTSVRLIHSQMSRYDFQSHSNGVCTLGFLSQTTNICIDLLSPSLKIHCVTKFCVSFVFGQYGVFPNSFGPEGKGNYYCLQETLFFWEINIDVLKLTYFILHSRFSVELPKKNFLEVSSQEKFLKVLSTKYYISKI